MLTKEQLLKYDRQISLPSFGEHSQEQLLKSKILVVGLGGLGSIVALYLVAAGIGQVGIMDEDKVSITNLHRQILFRLNDIDKNKVVVAKNTLQTLNTDVNIVEYPFFLNKDNCTQIISQYDIVIDATDNFASRYLINDTCCLLDKPFIYGSIGDYIGQMCVFNYKKPCATYRTLYPNENKLIHTINKKGVIGVLPCVIASLQVNEAIKMITNIGEVCKDTLFTINLLTLQTTKLRLPINSK